MGRDMPPFDGSRPARIVNTDIAEPATCDFGRVEEPGYHGGADPVGAADEPLTGFMRHLPQQSLMIFGMKDGHPHRHALAHIGAG